MCKKEKVSQKYQTRKSPHSRKCFFLSSFSSFSSSDRLVQNCVTLSQWFWCKTAAFITEQCTSPSLFYNFEVSRSASNWTLKNYMAFLMPFSSLVCMHTNHLATKSNCYSRLKYGGVHGDGESPCHPLLTWCLNRAWSMILQPILHTLTEEACGDRLAAL